MKDINLTVSMIKDKEKSSQRGYALRKFCNNLPAIFILGLFLLPMFDFVDDRQKHQYQDSITRFECSHLTTSFDFYNPARVLASFYPEESYGWKAYSIFFHNPKSWVNASMIYHKVDTNKTFYYPNIKTYDIDSKKTLKDNYHMEANITLNLKLIDEDFSGFSLDMKNIGLGTFNCSDFTPVNLNPYWNKFVFRRLNLIYIVYSIILIAVFIVNKFKARRVPIMTIIAGNTIQISYFMIGYKFGEIFEFSLLYPIYFFFNLVYSCLVDLRIEQTNHLTYKFILIFVIPLAYAIYSFFFINFFTHYITEYITIFLLGIYSFIDAFYYLRYFTFFQLHLLFLFLQAWCCLNIYDGFGQTFHPFCILFLIIFLIYFGISWLSYTVHKKVERAFDRRFRDPGDKIDINRFEYASLQDSVGNEEANKPKKHRYKKKNSYH